MSNLQFAGLLAIGFGAVLLMAEPLCDWIVGRAN